MTPLQRQAVLVCVVCALAALLTIGITLTLLRRGKVDAPNVPDADSVSSETPAISHSSDIVRMFDFSMLVARMTPNLKLLSSILRYLNPFLPAAA